MYNIVLFVFFLFGSSPAYAITVTFDDTAQQDKIDGVQAVLWVQNGLLSILIILVMWAIIKSRR